MNTYRVRLQEYAASSEQTVRAAYFRFTDDYSMVVFNEDDGTPVYAVPRVRVIDIKMIHGQP